ncbi:MAG TPA: monovalent cation/H+ antiporter subunit A [Burkholderiaceae bacterium]|nr:monovalent cation/H+ antiporter subunit A [Burkholderiaceae bacterium]
MPALLVLLPFAGALLLAVLPNERRRLSAWLAGVFPLAGLALALLCAPSVFAGEVLRWSVDWVPTLGLSLGFRMDGLAWLFALLILGIGALVVLYAAYYLHHDDPPARFFQFLLLFMGAMLGVVLADNLLLLVVFWEATSLSSFLLIGFWTDRKDAREGARMALAITGAGGLALLAGVLLIGHIVGSVQLDAVLAAGPTIRAHVLYMPALVLVLFGAFTKSAQFPFHFWLPHAMAAPTPVSAYLHSATMVKAGVFLLARLYPALGGSDAWFWLVAPVGLATLLLGAYFAIFKHDLKGLLAYSTISHLGLITLLFGLDTPLAVVAAVFHILNHATFKASLFMAAGIIDHETGSRDMRKLNGLWKYMPWTALLAIVASSAMAGVPLLNGFLSKEMFFAEALESDARPVMAWLLPVGATLAGVFSVAYSTRFIHDVFFNGEPVGLPRTPHEPPRFMRVPVEVLVLVCLAVGIAPGLTVGPVLAAGARSALGAPLPDYSLAIWHGLSAPLLMSLIALGGGVTLYFGLQRFINLHRIVQVPRGGREAFVFVLARTVKFARELTLGLQNGSLQRYLLLLVVMALTAGLLPFLVGATLRVPSGPSTPLSPAFALLCLVGVAAALATLVEFRRRLLALTVLGAVGLVVALLFVILSAPDLALTQLLVEVATVILMMLALNWLPQESPPERSTARRTLHALVAGVAGLGAAALVWLVLSLPFDSISPYFLQAAVPLGGGANAVNVIIVDYRGFDTLGEITVLGIAALIVAALLHGRRPPELQGRHYAVPTERNAHPLMLKLVTRLLLPLAVLVSLHLFLRGHNLPGGGFIAGLVLAIAMVLLSIAHGEQWVSERLRSDFRRWIGAGLLIAALTGAGSWLLGHPYLTSTYQYPVLPLVGAVPLASASLFDLGVFLTVVGGTMVMLTSIGRLRPDPGSRPS